MFDDTEYRKAMDVVVTRFQEEMKKSVLVVRTQTC